jgi:flagellar biogenesis protein FliO
MVFSLGVLVVLLIAGAYLVRRYLVPQTLLGRRGPLLRVVAKVPLTPKTAIALVEVPGKVLVVGITSTTLTALGEVEPAGIEPQTQEPEAEKPLSFPAILEQQTQEEQHNPDEAVLHVPEAIQKKLRALKRL